ncbi:MAG: hypothetical protein JNK82_19460 [Myxococcaceae bacterium]|nr:hypothetical protein [Myxococcaceae bacterium]
MKLFSTLAAVAAVVTGQDGGVRLENLGRPTSPPAQATTRPPTDGGTPAPRVDNQMVPAQQTPTSQNAAAVQQSQQAQQQVQQLKTELQSQNAKLDTAVNELQQVKTELQTKNANDARQAQAAEAQRQAAVTLGAVDQQLLQGNTAIEGQLSAVESSLGPSARANLAAARQALANSDLASARYYLSRAATDAQAGR